MREYIKTIPRYIRLSVHTVNRYSLKIAIYLKSFIKLQRSEHHLHNSTKR